MERTNEDIARVIIRNPYGDPHEVGYPLSGDGTTLHLNDGNVIDILSVPVEVDSIICTGSYVRELKVPEGINEVDMFNNPLEHIELPDTVFMFHCHRTNLRSLELPKHLRTLNCRHTFIEELELPSSLKRLMCDNTVTLHNVDEVMKNPDATIRMYSRTF